MSRVARIVVPGVPHHITQRGNRRADVFFSDEDRRAYLRWLRAYGGNYRDGNYRDGLRNRAGICPNDAAGRLSMRRSVIRDETRTNPAEASASQETRPQAQTDDAVCHQRKPEDVF